MGKIYGEYEPYLRSARCGPFYPFFSFFLAFLGDDLDAHGVKSCIGSRLEAVGGKTSERKYEGEGKREEGPEKLWL